MHRPCKHYSNIVNDSLHHVYSFFFHFLAIFVLMTILGNAHRLYKWYSNTITNNSYFHLILLLLFIRKCQNLPYLAIFNVHSGHCILVPCYSSQFQGLCQCKYQNATVPVTGVIFWLVESTGMPQESTGMTRIQQEYIERH